MRCLYIDTSSNFLYSGIVNGDKLETSVLERMDHELSKNAMLRISEMFKRVNLSPNDIDKIIVVNGPGSFTGIRIGITIAKVFAWGLDKEISMISSLEAMATSGSEASYIVPVIDARREYVYAAIYDENGKAILEPQHILLDQLRKRLSKLSNYQLISNDDINIDCEIKEYIPDILAIVKRYCDRPSQNPHTVNPNYLKLTEAEEKNKNV